MNETDRMLEDMMKALEKNHNHTLSNQQALRAAFEPVEGVADKSTKRSE